MVSLQIISRDSHNKKFFCSQLLRLSFSEKSVSRDASYEPLLSQKGSISCINSKILILVIPPQPRNFPYVLYLFSPNQTLDCCLVRWSCSILLSPTSTTQETNKEISNRAAALSFIPHIDNVGIFQPVFHSVGHV